MTPIRPTAAPPLPQTGPSQDAGKLAAQKAFFAMVSGQAQAAPAAAPSIAAQPVAAAVPAPVNRIATAPAEAPAKVLRPGSLLDIRV